jgi:PAS domain S-box-containing protein
MDLSQFIQRVLDAIPLGVAVNTIDDGILQYMNPRFEEIYGWPRDLLTDVDSFFECVYQDAGFREKIRRQVMEDIGSGEPGRMRWRDVPITTRSGEQRFVTAANIPIPEQNLMVSTVQDVTDRKLAEAALSESARRQKELIDGLNDGVFETDEEGVITFASKGLARILDRREPDTLLGLPIWEVVEHGSQAELHDLWRRILEQPFDAPAVIDSHVEGPDGTHLHVEIKPAPILMAGEVTGRSCSPMWMPRSCM